MVTRTSVLLLLVGAVVGYAFGSPSARAQASSVYPIAEGDSITITYDRHSQAATTYVNCKVTGFVGNYVRCASNETVMNRDEEWWSLDSAAKIVKRSR
jgi:hypothetical protein